MTNEELRKDFEEWITASPYSSSITRFPNQPDKSPWPDQYVDTTVQVAWEAWQRAAVSYTGMVAHHDGGTGEIAFYAPGKCQSLVGFNPPVQATLVQKGSTHV